MSELCRDKASADILDLQNISNTLEQLPRDKLMYVAGAVTALAATSGDERNREEK